MPAQNKKLSNIRLCLLVVTTTLLSLFVVQTLFTIRAQAVDGINKQINFQGKLQNSNGTNVADGNYSVVFTLYDAASNGTNLWTETQSVSTTDGIFRVSLGSVNSALGSVNFNSDSLYLGIKVGADDEMTPRVRFTAVPYAFNAQKVNGLTVTNTSDAPFSSATTLKIADGKTVSITSGLTFSGTDSTTFTFPSSSGTVVTLDASQVLTNKSIGSSGLTFSGATTDITTGTNEDLVISPNGTGRISLGTTSPIGLLTLEGRVIGKALMTLNQLTSGDQDLFVASQAGIARFVIGNSGSASMSGMLTVGDGSTNNIIRTPFGPLTFQYKSGANAWTSGLFMQDLTGNIGIGTSTSLSSKLNVNGSISANGAMTGLTGLTLASGAINLGGTNGTTTQCLTGGSSASWVSCGSFSQWTTSGSNVYYSTGNVGIGTTNPSLATLQIAGTGLIKSTTNSTSAFQVQRSSTNNEVLFNVDTASNNSNNLLTNPSVEAAISGNWTAHGSATVSQDSTTSYYGSSSLKIVTTGANNGAKQNVALSSNTTYTFVIYAKANSLTTNFSTLEIGRSENGSTDTSCRTAQTVIRNGFTRYVCSFTTGTVSGTTYIYAKQTDSTARPNGWNIDAAILETDANSSNFYREGRISLGGDIVSPVIIKPNVNSSTAFQVATGRGAQVFGVDTTDTNLLAGYAGFESNQEGWTFSGSSAQGSVVRNASFAQTGIFSLQVTTTAVANLGARFTWGSLIPNLAVSTQHTLSWHDMVSSGTFTDISAVYSPDGNSANEVTCTPSDQIVKTNGFTRRSCTFTTSAITPTSSAYLTIRQGGATARTFYIDGVQLEAGNTMTMYGAGSLILNAPIVSPLGIRNITNSTTALQVQNTAGTALLGVDTVNSLVTLGGSLTSTSGAGLSFLASGSTSGNGNNASVYFRDSTNSVKGRLDTSPQATPTNTAGDGHDGSVNLTSGTNNCTTTAFTAGRINPDCLATAITSTTAAGSKDIPVGSSAGLFPGDEIMLIQMTGTGAGNYEFWRVSRTTTTTITLNNSNGTTYTYTNNASSKAQVVRVPNYRDFTISGSTTLTVSAWNGTTGGILAFRVLGKLTNAGTIQANGTGMTGGAGSSTGGTGGTAGLAGAVGNDGGTGNTGSVGNTPSGSGASTGGTGGTGGIKGAASATTGAGGGGGGGGTGGGGAGGAYRTTGSAGNSGSGATGGKGAPTGGAGGLGGSGSVGGSTGSAGSTYGVANLSSLFVGSGGAGGGSGAGGGGGAGGVGGTTRGAGGAGATGGAGGTGGTGGGIIFIESGVIDNTGGTISSNGSNGSAASVGVAGTGAPAISVGAAAVGNAGGGGGGSGAGGGGGGGSGGSVFIKTGNLIAAGTLSATGGTGGNTNTGGAGGAGGNSAGSASSTNNAGGGGGGGGGNAGGAAGAAGVASGTGATNNQGSAGTAATATTNPTGQTGGSGRIHCETPTGTGCTGADSQGVNTYSTGNSYGTLFIGTVNTFSADLAEYYTAGDQTIEEGEVVIIDEIDATSSGILYKTTIPYDRRVVGVISTDPGLILGSPDIDPVKMSQQRKLALTGRVPVKVTTQNGDIKVGDYLTSSQHPGIAMKATKAGPVIGQALNDYSGDTVGLVNVLVKASYYNGDQIEDRTEGLETSNDELGRVLLRKMLSDKISSNSASLGLSQIWTDRLLAGLEVITPKIITDVLSTNTISIASGSALSFQYEKDGTVSFSNGGNDGITFDGMGNATFSGNITAKSIRAEKIEGLEFSIIRQLDKMQSEGTFLSSEDLEESVLDSSSSAEISNHIYVNSQTNIQNSLLIGGLATVSADLRVKGNGLVEGMLSVIDTVMTKNIIVSGVATFFKSVVIKGDVEIEGHLKLGKDTAGTVIIENGKKSVDIKFDKEYEELPVVTASIISDKNNDELDDEELEKIFLKNQKFIITKRSTKGFTIQLMNPADENLEFSWMAVQINKK